MLQLSFNRCVYNTYLTVPSNDCGLWNHHFLGFEYKFKAHLWVLVVLPTGVSNVLLPGTLRLCIKNNNMYVEHIMFLKIQIVMLGYVHLIVKTIALFCPSWSIEIFHHQIIKSKLVTHSISIYLLSSYYVFQGLF